MNRVILNVSLLFCSLLVSCSSISKSLANTMAASEEVEITSFDCTYNSETSKYDCLVEGINSTEKYMVLSELKMAANNDNYLPVKTDSPFFTSILVKPGESFEVKYEAESESNIDNVRLFPSFVTWEVNDIDFVELVRYESAKTIKEFASFTCFYLKFNNVLSENRFVNNEDCYFDYRAINFITYGGINYCIRSNYVLTDYSETVEVYIGADQQIDASEIGFENVIIVEKKRKNPFRWTDEDRANLIRVFKYILLALLCGGIVFAVGSIVYFVIRRRKKQISNK